MVHCVLERLKEVFLELEVRQFFLLQEPHRQLAQSIQGKEGNVRIGVRADLVEMLAEDRPHVGPLETNAVHVVVRDLDEFL